MSENVSSYIANYYADKSVFVTGATGFIGKVLIEKLLRSCHEIRNIYVLVRPKKDQEPDQRLEGLLKDKVFERAENERPGSLAKLVAITGDLTLPDLGISPSDQLLLTSNVSVVFNSAATVRFDEKLKLAIQVNVLSVRHLLNICRKIEHLEALVHLSTAFSNCERETVDEIVYDVPVSPKDIINTTKLMDEDLVDEITPHLIGDKPNTYTYTKALAETLLVDECDKISVAIIRPSIVTAAWKEPFPGWVDNYNGMTGILALQSKGLMRPMLSKTATASIIPVDVLANLIITVGWHIASHRSNKIEVYNCSAGKDNNKLAWKTADHLVCKFSKKYPSQEMYFYPQSSLMNRKISNFLYGLLYNYIIAYLADFCSALLGRNPKFVPMLKKVDLAVHHLKYFVDRDWTFNCNNVFNLLETLSPQDIKEFNFDIRNLNWSDYLKEYMLGIRQFLLKEEPSSIPDAIKNLNRLYAYTTLGYLLLIFFLFYMIHVLIIGNIIA